MSNTLAPITSRLVRSTTDQRVAGVCGGLAQYFGIDSLIVRLAFILLTVSGPGLLIYPLLWVLTPRDGTSNPSLGGALHEMRDVVSHGASNVKQAWQSRRPQPRFDPYTGQPLPEAKKPKFDPMTGKPVQEAVKHAKFDSMTGQPLHHGDAGQPVMLTNLPSQSVAPVSEAEISQRRRRGLGIGLVIVGALAALPLLGLVFQYTFPILILAAGIMILRRTR